LFSSFLFSDVLFFYLMRVDMKKLLIAATIGLFSIGMTACTEEKKEAHAPVASEEATTGEEHKHEHAGEAHDAMHKAGEKVEEAVTDVKKDVENAVHEVAAPAVAPAPAEAPAAPAAAPAH
jgi:hypothetical protein